MNYIVNCYSQLSQADVGNKFYRQSIMLDRGISVPKFFCLRKNFYDRLFGRVKAGVEKIVQAINFDSNESVVQSAKEIRKMINECSLTQEETASILAAFDQMFGRETSVSVRASTVGHRLHESEDSSNNPFAGMSDSYLYVKRSNLIDKIKKCLSSGYSAESMIYRHAQNMDVMGFSVAVGIQKMVPGSRSFVLFTANPKTAANDAVICAGYGIGEGVVQEIVSVDHYFVSAKTENIEKTTTCKQTKLTLDKQLGEGIVEKAVSVEKQNIPCLSDAEILRVFNIGKKIESMFGSPQDIEGTFDENGNIFILQSRSIAFDYDRQIVWSNTNVTESYPDVCTTLTYTHAKFFYRVIFHDFYRRLNIPTSRLWNNFSQLDEMIGYIKGRVYYSLSNFYFLHAQIHAFPLFRSHWESMIGLDSSYQTSEKTRTETIKGKIQFSYSVLTILFSYLKHDKAMSRFFDWWSKEARDINKIDLKTTDPIKLVSIFKRMWRGVGQQWGVTLTTDAYLLLMHGVTVSLFKRWELDKKNPGLLSDLLCGDEQILSVEIILSAVNLATYAKHDAHILAMFHSQDDNALWMALNSEERSSEQGTSEFLKMLDVHINNYGDRGLNELKMEQPSMKEAPWLLLKFIRRYLNQNISVEEFRDHEQQVRAKADKELCSLLETNPLRHFILDKILLPRLRRMVLYRENSRYCRSELFGFGKVIFKLIGDYLVSKKVLRSCDDVFHLSQDEIFGYINGTGVTDDLQAIADIRHKEYLAYHDQAVVETTTTIGPVRENSMSCGDSNEDSSQSLSGLGSSAGVVKGVARVVKNPNLIDQLAENTILIARETDPGWLFLMLACKGIVVERGSMLSHTAITGRKFGIPTIVALPGATEKIPDGALIEINGGSGEVVILSTDNGSIQQDKVVNG